MAPLPRFKGSVAKDDGAGLLGLLVGLFRFSWAEKRDIRPALREVGGEANHRCPVVKESSVACAKYRLVIDAISESHARLKIVIRVVHELATTGNTHVLRQIATRNTRRFS